jgi:hypothetical protein
MDDNLADAPAQFLPTIGHLADSRYLMDTYGKQLK